MPKVFLAEKSSITPLWTINLDNEELLVGILAAGLAMMDDINYRQNYEVEKSRHFDPNVKSTIEYYVDTDLDVSSYRIVKDVIEYDVIKSSAGKLYPGQYGMWLRGSARFHYNLYAFKTNYFFQGIISMCNGFGVDFRNYIFQYPFDGNGNLYALDDYLMTPNMIYDDVPDLDDVDQEEADDENVIEPLANEVNMDGGL